MGRDDIFHDKGQKDLWVSLGSSIAFFPNQVPQKLTPFLEGGSLYISNASIPSCLLGLDGSLGRIL